MMLSYVHAILCTCCPLPRAGVLLFFTFCFCIFWGVFYAFAQDCFFSETSLCAVLELISEEAILKVLCGKPGLQCSCCSCFLQPQCPSGLFMH